MMNTVNKSTGFTPFQLRFGQNPKLIPPLVPAKVSSKVAKVDTWHIIHHLEIDVLEAQDNLLKAKIAQSVQANKHCMLSFLFSIGLHVRLSTLHRHNEFKAKGEKHVTKFMPQYDGPYNIVDVDEEHSTVTLNLPNSPNIHPTFHTSKVLPYIESNTTLFPSHRFDKLEPIMMDNGDEEYYIDCILDTWRRGHGYQYLVHWCGYGEEHDQWLPGSKLQDCEALDNWLASQISLGRFSFQPCQPVAFPTGF
jgi:hypothetical protein